MLELTKGEITNAVRSSLRGQALLTTQTPDLSAVVVSYDAGTALLRARRAADAIATFTKALTYVSGKGHALDFSWQGRLQSGIARGFLDLHNYAAAAPHAAAAAVLILKTPSYNLAELSVLENSGEVDWGFHRYLGALRSFAQAYRVLRDPRFRVYPVDRSAESLVVERLSYATGDANLQLRRPTLALKALAGCRSAALASIVSLCGLDSGEALLQGGHARAASKIFSQIDGRRAQLSPNVRILLGYLTAMASLDSGDGIGAASAARNVLNRIRSGGVSPFWIGLGYFTAFVTARTVRPIFCNGMEKCARTFQEDALREWRTLSVERIRRYRRLLTSADAFDTAAFLGAQIGHREPTAGAALFEAAAASEARSGDIQAAVATLSEAARERIAKRNIRQGLRDAERAAQISAKADWRSRWIAARIEVLADEAAHSPVAASRICSASLIALERERTRAAFYARWNPQLRVDSIDLGVASLDDIYADCEAQLMQTDRYSRSADRLAVELFNDDVGRRAFDDLSRSGALHIAGVPNTSLNRLRFLAERYVDAPSSVDAAALRVQLQHAERTLSARYPQLAPIMLPQAFTRPSSWQRVLAPNEAMLVDDISGNDLDVWVVTSASIRGVRLANAVPTLRRRVSELNGIVSEIEQAGGARRRIETKERLSFDSAATKLAALLLPRSLRDFLAPYRHLFVIPTGILYRISYATLRRNHRYLAQNLDLAYLSSPSLLPLIRRAEQAKRSGSNRSWLLAFANPELGSSKDDREPTRSGKGSLIDLPPLPDTAIEARRAAKAFAPKGNFRILSAGAASDRSLFQLNKDGRLENYRYLLFATHAVLISRPERGRRPYIVLSHPNVSTGSGLIGVADVMKLRLDARMVMLS
ncbi:MAG: CHAT domain-containing protein, partial [Candidatus Baltobacteraceae bacterium]